MKMKNIDTPAPCLSAFYVTSTSENKYIIYLSALDEVQEDFILSADKNEAILQLTTDVQKALDEQKIPMASAEVTMIPQNYVSLTDEENVKWLNRTLDLLDEDDDVQNVYTNWEEEDDLRS